jgi:hypothetical protein
VTVSAPKAVTVSIQRVTASGKVMRTLARRSAKRATVAATLKLVGSYAVRVGNQKRTIKVLAAPAPVPGTAPDPAPVAAPAPVDCSAIGVQMDPWNQLPAVEASVQLRLAASTVQAGSALAYEIVNTSPSRCLVFGLGSHLQRQQPDGSWVSLPSLPVPAIALVLAPGQTFAKQPSIPADAEPGTYRVLDAGLSAGFEVVPVAMPVVVED